MLFLPEKKKLIYHHTIIRYQYWTSGCIRFGDNKGDKAYPKGWVSGNIEYHYTACWLQFIS